MIKRFRNYLCLPKGKKARPSIRIHVKLLFLPSDPVFYVNSLAYIKDIINLYFTKFAVICLSPSISPSNQHINGCFILTENWYALPMVFFLLLGTQNKMTRYHILKYLGPKACQSTCSYLFWSRNI